MGQTVMKKLTEQNINIDQIQPELAYKLLVNNFYIKPFSLHLLAGKPQLSKYSGLKDINDWTFKVIPAIVNDLDDFMERKAAKKKKKQQTLDDFIGDNDEQISTGTPS